MTSWPTCPRLLLDASSDGTYLRRFLYDKADGNISTATETLVRIVTRDREPTDVSRAALINLHTAAFSELDTISPVSLLADDDLDSGVATIEEALKASERVRQRLEEL